MSKKKLIITILILFCFAILFIVTKSSNNNQTTSIKSEIVNNGAPIDPVQEQSIKQELLELVSKKYNKPTSFIVLNISINTGLYAKGSLQFKDEQGGGLWFAAKTDNGWELAFDGNGIISCDIATKYNFPADMVPGCIDTQNNNQFVKR